MTTSDGAASTTGNPKIVGNIKFWMRAYPRRWRAVRGAELVDLVVDLSAPGAERLRGHVSFDLVRGGLATRWREHPPLHTWLLYRSFDRRIPVAYRAWALDDIDGFWFPARRYLLNTWPFFMMLAAIPLSSGSIPIMVGLFNAMTVASMFIGPASLRRRARDKHVTPRFGGRLVQEGPVVSELARERLTARSALTWAAMVLGLCGAVSMGAALFPQSAIRLLAAAWNEPQVPDQLMW